jgi:Leucine-rich repeat (LRR) protein
MINMRGLGYITFFLLMIGTFTLHAQVKSSNAQHQSNGQVRQQAKMHLLNQAQNDTLQGQLGTISAEDLEKYRKNSLDIISFLEGTLNFLGDRKSVTQEKEIIINNSFSKIFLTPKVQIEDDLDERRKVPFYKDVQAYLKDIDFFFKGATFKFRVDEVQYAVNGPNNLYFKITVTRQLNGRTIQGDTVNSTKVRYIELNLDPSQNTMKIASIYTTKLNEDEELQNWWNKMPVRWKLALGRSFKVNENIDLTEVMYYSDSLTLRKNDTVVHVAFDTAILKKESITAALRKLVKSRYVDISGFRSIDSLDPLAKLTDLQRINISGTKVKDLTPIRNLNFLEDLNISNCQIQDLSPLRYMKNIKDLDASNTGITDLSPLSYYTNLERLNISGTKVDSLDPIYGLSSLTDLRFNNSKISNLLPIKGLQNLSILQFSGTPVSDITPVSMLNKLVRLDFKQTAVSSLDSLSHLTALQLLFCDQTPVNDLRPIEGLPMLKRIYCDASGIKKPEVARFGLKRPGVLVIFESEELLKWWTELTIEWKKVFVSLASISATPNKEELHSLISKTKVDISGNQKILNIDPVEKFMNLQSLNIAGTQIISIEPIKELVDLNNLNLSDTRITSISALRNLKNLEELNLDKLPVTILDPIYGLSNLKLILMDGLQASLPLKDTLRRKIPNCLVVYKTDSLQRWWSNLSPDWKTIFGYSISTPNRIQLHQIQNLKELSFKDNVRISDLIPLKTLDRIQKLQFTGTSVSDLTPLATQRDLLILKCSNNPIQDLNPLKQLVELVELDIEGTQVHSVEVLQNLKNLKVLCAGGTQISSIKYLKGLTSLKRLEIFNTRVGSLSALETVQSLKLLRCYNAKIGKREVGRFKEIHPDCEVVYY